MAALKITGKGAERRDRHFYVAHPVLCKPLWVVESNLRTGKPGSRENRLVTAVTELALCFPDP